MQQVHKGEASYMLDDVTEKIVRVLLENPAIPYNKSQLAEAAGVSRNALYRRWETLEAYDLVEEAEVGSKETYWTLNADAAAADALTRLLYE